MPCDQIIVNSILFENAQGHEDILADAMRDLGYHVAQTGKTLQFSGNGVRGTYANGKFYTEGYREFKVDAIKRQFGWNAAKTAAKRNHWEFIDQGNFKATIRKRV